MSVGFELEAERHVVGSMPQGMEYLTEGLTALTVDDFSRKEYQVIFTLYGEMFKNGEEINPVSFAVKYTDKIKALGISWTNVTDVFANKAAFKQAIAKLKDATMTRILLGLSDRMRQGLESGESPAEIIRDTEKSLQGCNISDLRRYLSPKDYSKLALDVISERMDIGKKASYFTRFKRLNEISGGFEAGDLVIMSGNTGGGKSAFAMNIAHDIGITQKIPLLYINSEMSEKQMILRTAANLAKVSHRKLRSGEIEQEEFNSIVARLDGYYSGCLHLLTMPDLRVDAVIGEARRFKVQHDIKLLIIDYIGRCDFTDAKNRDDWQVLTGAARRLKTLAQELELVVIMLAQLNESGRLAQASYMSHEADLWINLKKVSEEEARDYHPWNTLLQIKKARNAQTGDIGIYFYGDQLLFTGDKNEAAAFSAMAAKQSA